MIHVQPRLFLRLQAAQRGATFPNVHGAAFVPQLQVGAEDLLQALLCYTVEGDPVVARVLVEEPTRMRRVEAVVLQFWGVSGVGRRSEFDDGPDIEGTAVGTEEIGGEPAAPEDRADVARCVHFHARHAEVARLHPCQVVYEYPHVPPTGERP